MNTGGWLCSHCKERSAEAFCLCSEDEVYVCDTCYSAHRKRSPLRKHSMKPIGTLPYHKVPGYYERLRQRDEAFPRVKQSLLDNLSELETLISSVEGEMEAIIAAFKVHCEAVLADLRRLKEELKVDFEASLEEVVLTLLEDQPVLLSRFGPLVRRCLVSEAQPIFAGRIISIPLDPQSLLSVTYSVTENYTHYPYIADTSLAIYQISSKNVLQYPLPSACGQGSTFCVLNSAAALYIGGLDPSSYVLSLETGESQKAGEMPVAKQDAGMVRAKSCVYVFGGHDGFGPMVECEKFSIKQRTWTSLSPMNHPRSEFCPCVHRNDVYLVSTSSQVHRAMEAFNLSSERFRVLEVAIPAEVSMHVTSVSVVCEGSLVVLTGGKQLVKWRLQGWKGEVHTSTQAAWNTCVPLVLGSQVLVAGRAALLKFDLETQQFCE